VGRVVHAANSNCLLSFCQACLPNRVLAGSRHCTVLTLNVRQNALKEVTPTVGFNVEQFSRSSINFTVFDMSGAGKYRNLWEHYYKDAQAIIFVIDCSDKLRMCVVKEELQAMLQNKDTVNVPTLFFANKIDISDHLSPVECVQYLDLDSVKDRPWHITPSNALTGGFCPSRTAPPSFTRMCMHAPMLFFANIFAFWPRDSYLSLAVVFLEPPHGADPSAIA
jgi:ADP-ribosylation factor-like protein 6